MKKNRPLAGRLSFLREKGGMTITNVIVAFVVLLLTISAFVGVVRLSQNLIVRADSMRSDIFGVLKKYYVNDPTLTVDPLTGEQSYIISSGSSSFVFHSSLYAYSDDGYTIYSFGEHTLPGT